MAWHRARTAHGMPPTTPQTAAGGRLSVTGTRGLPGGNSANPVTLSHRPLKLPKGIVPDAKWPGMYRLNGTLSDMVNLTRAKDALRQQQNETSRAQGTPQLSLADQSCASTRSRSYGPSPGKRPPPGPRI